LQNYCAGFCRIQGIKRGNAIALQDFTTKQCGKKNKPEKATFPLSIISA